MSGVLRWRKLREVAMALDASSNYRLTQNWNWLHVRCAVKRRESLIGIQERYKWDHGGGAGGTGDEHRHATRRIRAEANCPRCSKQMHLLFTNRPHHLIPPPSDDANSDTPPIPDTDNSTNNNSNGGGAGTPLLAVNLCPNCKTAYYFRPFKMSPLQGSFVEIGRVKGKNSNTENNKLSDAQDYGKMLRPSFWETLRSYGSEPPENWPPPPPPSGNGIAVHSPPGPPSAPGVNVTRASGPCENGGNAGHGANTGEKGT